MHLLVIITSILISFGFLSSILTTKLNRFCALLSTVSASDSCWKRFLLVVFLIHPLDIIITIIIITRFSHVGSAVPYLPSFNRHTSHLSPREMLSIVLADHSNLKVNHSNLSILQKVVTMVSLHLLASNLSVFITICHIPAQLNDLPLEFISLIF